MWHLEPAWLQGQTTTKPVNAFPDAANQPFWAGECEASWMRACRFQGSNPTHIRNQLKTDVPFSKEEARTRAREEPGLETLAGDLPSAPRTWIWEPGIWWSHSLGRMPCFNWHPRLCRRKSTMAGPPGPVWKGWEHCSEEFPTLSTHHPTAFIQHEILVLSWAPDMTFKTHRRNTGFQQIKSCSAFDCNEVDIKGHSLHVCPHSGHLPGGGVLLQRNQPLVWVFFLRVGFGALLGLSTQHHCAVIATCFLETRVGGTEYIGGKIPGSPHFWNEVPSRPLSSVCLQAIKSLPLWQVLNFLLALNSKQECFKCKWRLYF